MPLQPGGDGTEVRAGGSLSPCGDGPLGATGAGWEAPRRTSVAARHLTTLTLGLQG